MHRNHIALTVLPFALLFVGCEPALEYRYNENTKPPEVQRDFPNLNDVVIDADGVATLSGSVKKWHNGDPVSDAYIFAEGINPPVDGQAGADGVFVLPDVQVGGLVTAKTWKEGYAYTYEQFLMPAGNLDRGLYSMSQTDLDAWAVAFGVTPNAACGTLLIDVKNQGNAPQSGINGVSLANAAYAGPYYLNDDGTPYAGGTSTQAYGKMLFMNVCDNNGTAIAQNYVQPGLTITQDGYYFQSVYSANVYPGNVTRIEVKVYPDNNVPDPNLVGVSFVDEIYPIFAAQGCNVCHAEGGQAAGTGLYLNNGAAEAYARLTDPKYPNRVNGNNPAQSLILQKPLYEEPPNHPNSAFASVDVPEYRLIYTWIQEGYLYDGLDNPVVIDDPLNPELKANVNFVASVAPRFLQSQCVRCHSGENPAGGLDLGGTSEQINASIGNNGLLYADNVNGGYDYELSKLYYYPSDPAHSGGVTAPYEDLMLYIGGWIYEGANFVPPGPVYLADVANHFNQMGCTGCHGANNPQSGLYLAGDPVQMRDSILEVLYYNNNTQYYYPYESELVLKGSDIVGPNGTLNHGGNNAYLADYYYEWFDVAQWIANGALQ